MGSLRSSALEAIPSAFKKESFPAFTVHIAADGLMVNIRLLTHEDDADYRTLWIGALQTQASCFRTVPDDEPGPGIPTCFALDNFTLGAFEDSQLLGIVSLSRDKGFKLRHKALLFRMFVHPTLAGRGVGKGLIRAVITQAEKLADLRHIHLTVLATNARAHALYCAQGFRDFALECGAVKINSEYVDEIRMMRFVRGPGPAFQDPL